MTISIYPGRSGWYWHAKRGGRIVADGAEAYTRKASALRAVRRFCLAMRGAVSVEVRE